MDETRAQAYLQLIETLLNCPNGEEPQILRANSELLDQGFLQVCEVVAENFAEEGQENPADFLRNLASQLRDFFALNDEGERDNYEYFSFGREEQYFGLWRKIFQTILDNIVDNSQNLEPIVYPLLSNNIDLLDSNFAIFLRLWAMATFAQMEQGIPQAGSADIIGHFSSLIINFSLGDKVANLEIAIVGYEVATTVLTRETYPEKWAMMKYSLALLRPVVKIVKDAQEAGFISNQIFFIQEILPDQDSWPQTFEEYLKYEDFLMELLQVTSNNDFQELAVILKSGINRLDKLFAQVLRKWAILEMFERDPQKAHIVATDIGNLISKIKDFPLGKRRDNLEIAIIGYYVISVLFTKENYPLQWAMLQMNLASAYCSRVQGNPAINLELSIAFYQSALQIFFVDKYKEYWAATQQNLGNAYANRIYGSRAENLNLAISAYQSVLQVLRLEDSSQMQIWAKTQSNLGNAYNDQVRGNRLEDVELAIGAYQAALQVYKPETFPEDWARTQTNLANSYSNRVKGDRSENLEIAIDYYQLALQVYKPETFPQEWARTKICLGSAYDDRIRGTREENLEQAITTYEEALQIYNREAFPKKWATTCMNLAVSYQHRLRGDREENQERAICLYQECLQVITQAQYPEQWAEVHINLANTYHNRLKGERTENLKQAIAATEGALQILTRQEFPERWAGIQVTLGTIYQKQRQVVEAIACFRAAIEVYQPRTFPIECLQAAGRLGYIASLAELWIEVIEGYDTAIQAVEQSRTWASTDRRKQEIISEVIDVYVGIVQAYIKINQPDKAIEYVERSKARNLVELLATRDLYPKGDIPEAVINELSRLRRAIDAEQRRVEIQQTNRNSNGGTISGERGLQIDTLQTTSRDSTNLTQLRQQLDELLVRDIKPIDPDFLLTQEVKSILYSDIQALTVENTAILEWYILGDKFLTFIITPQSPTPIVWPSSKTDFQALVNWGKEYLRDYQEEDKTQWRENLAPRLQSLSEILHINEILGKVPKHCDQLILIPHRFLHLFPLHALPVSHEIWKRFNPEIQSPEPTNPCLLDCFKQGVRYSPSCQLLQQAQRRKRPNFTHLFAVQNPTNDLLFTDLEVPAISQHFHPKDILVKNDAKKSVIDDSRLRIAHCAHFSCHGYFNFKQPLLSALLLADSELPPPPPEENPSRYLPLRNGKTLDLTKCLTLADIFALDFRECRLVVISACETGISDFSSISDEYISLPSGFLVAGSSSVVPTLWTVSDLSTSFLMIKFYQLLKAGLSVSLALNSAQLWLRDATKEDLQTWTSKLTLTPTQKLIQLPALFNKMEANAKPFQSPYHWAAFCAIGQ